MIDSMIAFDNVSKAFVSPRKGERVRALDNISFTVGPNEFVAIVGPSGCGKSTLLSLVAGLDLPSTGKVTFDGSEVVGPSPARGVLFQDYALFPWLTVQQNVEFGPRVRGIARQERGARAKDLISLVGLSGFEEKFPHELSGGMRQRCALARMLANDPQVWLMDEPFAAVDLQTRIVLQQELLRLWGDARNVSDRHPVLFVTHGIDEAVFLADRVLVLGRRPGRVKQSIEIDIPRPRPTFRNGKRMGELTEQIWELTRAEAEQAIADV